MDINFRGHTFIMPEHLELKSNTIEPILRGDEVYIIVVSEGMGGYYILYTDGDYLHTYRNPHNTL